jgi:hypothetical protein
MSSAGSGRPSRGATFRAAVPTGAALRAAERDLPYRQRRGFSGTLAPTRRRRAFHRPWRWALATVAAAGTALALVVAGGVARGPEGEVAAADVLRDAARVAAARPDPGRLTPGRFWYARSVGAWIATNGDRPPWSVRQEVTREFWVGADGSGRIKEHTGKAEFLTPQDRRNWEKAGRPDLGEGQNSDERFKAGELTAGSTVGTYDDLLALPTDPDKLYAYFHEQADGHSRGTDVEMFVLVSDVLRETPAPPALQAALYEVAARIPGVQLLGPTTDPAGRHGTGIAKVDRDGARHVLIFDPATATPLGERETATRPIQVSPGIKAPAGTVLGEDAELETGFVGSVTARP